MATIVRGGVLSCEAPSSGVCRDAEAGAEEGEEGAGAGEACDAWMPVATVGSRV